MKACCGLCGLVTSEVSGGLAALLQRMVRMCHYAVRA